ncbi:MAG: hypothetical protein EBS29_14595 [Chloroflexia bacterium]|nr:hypothetical protein [Chloroflexia bacterium]
MLLSQLRYSTAIVMPATCSNVYGIAIGSPFGTLQIPALSTIKTALRQKHSQGATSQRAATTKRHLVVCHAQLPLFASGWPVWTVLFTCAAAAQLIEHTALRSLSPPLVSIALGAAASAAGLVPTACLEYDVVWTFLMPIAAALYLLDANLSGYENT